ncbi:MAG: HAD family phosphatase [Eubacteriales bacterium]|nr:HAD family phosphatase [Eubacteriales bacterium]
MLKLVIFDMDGLLFDTETVTCRAFLEKGKEWGLEPTREQYIEFLGCNAEAICKKYYVFFGDDIDAEELFRQVGERKMEIIQKEGIGVKKGVRELLDYLESKGIPKAVASGSSQEMIEDNVRRTGLWGRFDYMLSTENVKRGKPYPDAFLEICKKSGVKPEEALVLEDAENGVKAAIAGQIPVINVPDVLELPEELKEQCVAVVDSLEEVIHLMETSGLC